MESNQGSSVATLLAASEKDEQESNEREQAYDMSMASLLDATQQQEPE